MKYKQIIGQAWQVLRQNKILWIFVLIVFLSIFISFQKTSGYICIDSGILLFAFILLWFSQFGMIYTTDKILRGELVKFKEILGSFKTDFGRLALFSFAIFIPYYFIYMCSSFLLRTVNQVFNITKDLNLVMILIALVTVPYASCVDFFGLYGLILGRLGVLKSVWHGITVFFMNWFKCLVFTICLQIPTYLSFLFFFVIMLLAGVWVNFNSSQLSTLRFIFDMWFTTVVSFTYLFSSITYLLAYYRFIQDFDYPTLRHVTRKT